MKRTLSQQQSTESSTADLIGSLGQSGLTTAFLSVRDSPTVEPMTESEIRSIAFADADGWRCFYPATRGQLTAAEARAMMRAERGLPDETAEEARAAEFVLAMESEWDENGSS